MLRNTIVANSSSGGNCAGPIKDGGYNIDDGRTCGFWGAGCTIRGGTSFCNTNPQLDPAGLQNNGGPTQTVALCAAAGTPPGCTAASPTIDAGDGPVCAGAPVNDLDQRGFARPGAGLTTCSIGAYEADVTAPVVCPGDCDASDGVTVDEIITLVNIALGDEQPSACLHGVPEGAAVEIALIIHSSVSDLHSGRKWKT
ncbi:MAG TPA: choice-of-anchor Q domain-containing protein, partial [Candidatus Margulisiibacteriota bacterium]|nr:choice-of-anchor Q domain-containing protein [Candidatus Margulisiibacteriota bacterium]